jgi:hypothetical protein
VRVLGGDYDIDGSASVINNLVIFSNPIEIGPARMSKQAAD